jgi:predicted Zn-dependent protease with MMP-like domain/Tfp pilus assembly protein PilF
MRQQSPSPDTDPVTAHLDRGWELLDRGDIRGAALAADAAAARSADSPELRTLRGAIAAADGQFDAAVAHYTAAIEADPEYATPILQAAELQLYSLDDPERALALAERATAVSSEDDERADAALLAAEALLALDRPDDARSALALLDGLRLHEAAIHTRAGQLYLDLGEPARAEAHLEAAIAADPDYADAHHTLGMLCELRGDLDGMRRAWLTTRRLDLQAPSPAWHVGEREFERIAEEAFDRLPDDVKVRLVNVPILISDYPSVEVIAEGNDPRMLGMFTGVPLSEKSNVGNGQPQPDCCFLYQRNIEHHCNAAGDVEHEIHVTLWHETAHFFGLEDDDLDELGLG